MEEKEVAHCIIKNKMKLKKKQQTNNRKTTTQQKQTHPPKPMPPPRFELQAEVLPSSLFGSKTSYSINWETGQRYLPYLSR